MTTSGMGPSAAGKHTAMERGKEIDHLSGFKKRSLGKT